MKNLEFVRQVVRKCYLDDLNIIIHPHDLNLDKSSQEYKSLAGQPGVFIEFYEYAFALSNSEIKNLQVKLKKFYIDLRLLDDNAYFVDYNLLQDMIDYQTVIRDIDGHLDLNLASDIAESFNYNRKKAKDFPEITSSHLINLLKLISIKTADSIIN